jgi:YD repeat-containing protein
VLDSVISVTTPDGTVVTTAYSGDRILVTDQQGNKRMSRTNALGQLKDVFEVTPNDSVLYPGIGTETFGAETVYGYKTQYDYDVLDNLTTVTQGTQQRFFMYDSLRRVIRAHSPEQDTLAALNLLDPVTNHSTWTNSYQYDDNGNLIVKKDARDVATHYQYDALNRLTRRWYNGSDDVTAAAHNTPALPTNVGPSDEVKLYYDFVSVTGAPAGFNRGDAA